MESAGLQIAFAPAGIIMATAFVSLPLVIRELVPVLQEIGTDQELAARSLGAGPWQTSPHHAAIDPLGTRVRRRAEPGPIAR